MIAAKRWYKESYSHNSIYGYENFVRDFDKNLNTFLFCVHLTKFRRREIIIDTNICNRGQNFVFVIICKFLRT